MQHLIAQHGGQVSVQSAGLGKGARFSVELPIRGSEHVSAAPVSLDSPAPPSVGPTPTVFLSGVRVLIVDDEPDSRAFLASLLAEQGADVMAADSASQAFLDFQAHRPDVVVSDIAMSEEDGYSFIRRIRSLPADQGGHVPAIALTAYARSEDERRALSAGFQLHLTKPIDVARIVEAVARLRHTRSEPAR